MDNDEALSAIARHLADDEARAIVDRFVAANPHWDGAHADDILETLQQADAHLDVIEPFYEAHDDELPDVPGVGYAVLAVIAMGRELTVPAVLDLLGRAGLTETPAPAAEVWYQGTGDGHTVAVEDQDGNLIEQLPHIEHAPSECHSPTGFSWGYAGSGPAELARNLLLHALGDAARCPACGGCRHVIWPKDPDAEGPIPFDTAKMDECDPETGGRCYDCDDGYRRLPYQDFKFEFVAGWGNGWRISQAEVRQWLAQRGVQVAEGSRP
jgi:hypothetical protein